MAAHQENAAKQPLIAQTGWSVLDRPPRPCLSKDAFGNIFDGTATPPVPGGDYLLLILASAVKALLGTLSPDNLRL